MAHNNQNDNKFISVLLGNKEDQKCMEVSTFREGYDKTLSQGQCERKESEDCAIINTPSVLNANDISDLKSLSAPGPHVFLLVLAEGEQPEEQLDKWEEHFPNMGPFTIFIMKDKTTLGKDSKMAARCLDIKDQGLYNSCKSFWGDYIHRPYKCVKMDKRSNTKKQRIDDNFDNHHEGEANQGRVSPNVTICLLGETGSGKSCSGNTILGSYVFLSKTVGAPVTTECFQSKSTFVYGIELKVLDTPDFFDEDLKDASTQVVICRQECEGDLCVYLLVIQIGRFTEGERDILERLEAQLGEIRDRTIILFTRGDDLESKPIEHFIEKTNQHLKLLIEKCGKRYHVFNNKDVKREQVEKLMDKIKALVKL